MADEPKQDAIDWSLTTWDGSRRAQLRAWRKLSLRERLEALEAMGEVAEQLARARAQGHLRLPLAEASDPPAREPRAS